MLKFCRCRGCVSCCVFSYCQCLYLVILLSMPVFGCISVDGCIWLYYCRCPYMVVLLWMPIFRHVISIEDRPADSEVYRSDSVFMLLGDSSTTDPSDINKTSGTSTKYQAHPFQIRIYSLECRVSGDFVK